MLPQTTSERAPNDGFPAIADIYAEHETSVRTRMILGEGTAFLPCPGLLKLEGVRQGENELLKRISERVPIDQNHTQHRTDEFDLVRLSQLPDGTPILQRSIKSNGGVWQVGYPVAVTGDWDEAVAYEPPPPPEVEKPKKGQR